MQRFEQHQKKLFGVVCLAGVSIGGTETGDKKEQSEVLGFVFSMSRLLTLSRGLMLFVVMAHKKVPSIGLICMSSEDCLSRQHENGLLAFFFTYV